MDCHANLCIQPCYRRIKRAVGVAFRIARIGDTAEACVNHEKSRCRYDLAQAFGISHVPETVYAGSQRGHNCKHLERNRIPFAATPPISIVAAYAAVVAGVAVVHLVLTGS